MENRGDYELSVPGKIESEKKEPSTPLDNPEIARREKRYLKVLSKLKPEHRELITDFASTLHEQDKYDQYKNDPDKRADLETELFSLGLNSKGVRAVMKYFNLPVVKEIK